MCSPETHRRSRCVGICDAVDCLDQHCCLRSCPGFCGSWHSCVTWKHQEVRSQAPAGLHCSPFTDFHPTSFLSDNPQRCHSTYWNWQRREFLFWNVSDRRAQKNRIILTKSHTGTLVTYSLGIQADVSLCRSTVSQQSKAAVWSSIGWYSSGNYKYGCRLHTSCSTHDETDLEDQGNVDTFKFSFPYISTLFLGATIQNCSETWKKEAGESSSVCF